MSLLEDVFLQDEANEAQELERVIEGDEYDERPRSLSSGDESDGGRREDEAEEDKRRVDPASTKTKRVTKNPRFILNPARLTGPRGIQVIPEHFKDFRFKGKGHEKEDLDIVLKKLEHWAYRLYPKFQFQDCLKKIETLGKKRPVMVHLHKIRTDQFLSEETVVQKDSSDDEAQPPQEEDEFDKLLQQQIDLARATPAPGSVKKVVDKSDQWARVMETPNRDDRSHLPMPKATSSPSINDEQKERMLRNRKLAEERRLARLKQATSMNNNTANTIIEIDETESVADKSVPANDVNNIIEVNDEVVPRKANRSQVIDSSDSDDECNVMAVNESIVVEVHNLSNIDEGKDDDKSKDKIVDNKEIDDKANDIEEMAVDENIHVVQDVIENEADSIIKSNNDKESDSVDVNEENCHDNNIFDGENNDDDKDNHDKSNSLYVEKNCDGKVIVDNKRNENVDEIVNKNTNDVVEDLSNKNIVDVHSNDLSENSDKDKTDSNVISKETTQGSPNSAQDDKLQPTDKVTEEFTEDIMDVDFNDDF